jgi:hypothetical protein
LFGAHVRFVVWGEAKIPVQEPTVALSTATVVPEIARGAVQMFSVLRSTHNHFKQSLGG